METGRKVLYIQQNGCLTRARAVECRFQVAPGGYLGSEPTVGCDVVGDVSKFHHVTAGGFVELAGFGFRATVLITR